MTFSNELIIPHYLPMELLCQIILNLAPIEFMIVCRLLAFTDMKYFLHKLRIDKCINDRIYKKIYENRFIRTISDYGIFPPNKFDSMNDGNCKLDFFTLHTMMRMIKTGIAIFDKIDDHCVTALMLCAKFGDYTCTLWKIVIGKIKLFPENKKRKIIDQQHKETGRSALMYSHNSEITKGLLSLGCNRLLLDNEHNSTLMVLCIENNHRDLFSIDEFSETIKMLCTTENEEDKQFILNYSNMKGFSPIIYALRTRKWFIAECLISLGCCVDLKNKVAFRTSFNWTDSHINLILQKCKNVNPLLEMRQENIQEINLW
jgi:hypothetical protein